MADLARARMRPGHNSDTGMRILCLGFSHNTAPLELRERLSYPSGSLRTALAHFAGGHNGHLDGISELAILSTCNRTELYASVATPAYSVTSFEDLLSSLVDFIVETRGLPRDEFAAHLYRYAGPEAARHLCRVAAGLDSLVLGEPQILGQVAVAYEAALGQSAAGPLLSALFRTAIRAGKRARTETDISRNPASVSSVAARLADRVVKDLARASVLVVGAGEMGVLTVEALRLRGVQQIGVANRTQQRAAELAQRWGGPAFSFEQLPEAIAGADIVISATGAPHAIIGPALVAEALPRRAARSLVLIDIAVPRDVDPAVRGLPGVHLFDIDDLQTGLQGGIAERRGEIPRVETIVTEEVAAFEAWLQKRDVLPVIKDLRIKAEAIRQSELQRTLRRLPNLDPVTREHIQRLSQSLVNKLLHEPTIRLRAGAGNGQAAGYVEVMRDLFDLPVKSAAGRNGREPSEP